MIELLSPAGSPEAVRAAVQAGAGAVYLGFGDFNARRNAKNFTEEEFREAVRWCHVRGARVFLTMNTLLRDRELPRAAEHAALACAFGVDAILVQDLGVAAMLRQAVPEVELHASTQMTVHSLEGVLRCAELGMTRVVLSRELSRDAIAEICEKSPVEIEIFVHGALCMCYSGQCFFSALIGSRSGNRGLCAQPCRLPYGFAGKADQHPLSLKDMSLAGHLKELEELGVACLKLEGRMKRPEYVSVVTGIYARALKEGRDPTPEELMQLEQAFSREGFTDGYFTGRRGREMFGVRTEQPEPKELFREARASYEGREAPLVPVRMVSSIRAGAPASLTVTDPEGRTVTVTGPVPEAARNRALTEDEVSQRLAKTGGTPFFCEAAPEAAVDGGLMLPASALNALRREALEQLEAVRGAPPERKTGRYEPPAPELGGTQRPSLIVSLRRASQFSPALLETPPERLELPAEELAAHPELIEACLRAGTVPCAALPRICWDREQEALYQTLLSLRSLGVDDALLGTLDLMAPARRAGLALRADFGLGVTNSETGRGPRRLRGVSPTAPFELNLAQLRDLGKALPTEIIAYGRLPLMITENRLAGEELTDRRGARFPVLPAPGGRSEIQNAKTLYLADRLPELASLGVSALRLRFTTEDAPLCAEILREYREGGVFDETEHTRGLYTRGVE